MARSKATRARCSTRNELDFNLIALWFAWRFVSWLSQPTKMDKQAFLDQAETLNRRVHDVVKNLNGSFSAEHGIGRIKTGDMLHYKSAVEMTLMRQIKNALDPDGIMNPGVILD